MPLFGLLKPSHAKDAAIGSVDAATARQWHGTETCCFIDIREDNEFASGHIPGALAVPLSRFEESLPADRSTARAVFYCLSGMRTRTNAARLAAAGFAEAYILDGGINGWKAAGAPTA
jgi:rhodanese-related sulfurtransferase